MLMQVDKVTIMNWMAVIFLIPAAALLAFETYRQRVRGKSSSTDVITSWAHTCFGARRRHE